jgi:hypothetical protein
MSSRKHTSSKGKKQIITYLIYNIYYKYNKSLFYFFFF